MTRDMGQVGALSVPMAQGGKKWTLSGSIHVAFGFLMGSDSGLS